MNAVVLRSDAGRIPLADESVDLIVTSPIYWRQRDYETGGGSLAGQLGAERTAAGYLENLWAVTAECWRVLKPTGSMFVNLGDKRAGSGAPGTTSGLSAKSALGANGQIGGSPRLRGMLRTQGERSRMDGGYQVDGGFGRDGSKMMLPHRFAIGCEDGQADPDGIGWVVRQDQVWCKPNGMPESVTNRTTDKHEFFFHLTRASAGYYADLHPLRTPLKQPEANGSTFGGKKSIGAAGLVGSADRRYGNNTYDAPNPAGALPRSWWDIATEPFSTGDVLAVDGRRVLSLTFAEAWRLARHRFEEGVPLNVIDVDHFAAFPTEWPRRLVLGFTPPGYCLSCSDPRRNVVTRWTLDESRPQARKAMQLACKHGLTQEQLGAIKAVGLSDTGRSGATQLGRSPAAVVALRDEASSVLGGYAREFLLLRPADWEYRCLCDDTSAPTRPAVVLDPFGGTGTTAMVARSLGRLGISCDLSTDYCALARWRIFESGGASKVRTRTNAEAQTDLFSAALGDR